MKIDLSSINQFGSLELLAKQLVEGFITGLHKSPYHGFSVEFAEHRLYNAGESTRNIDWKVYAKTDRLYSKRFEEETNLRCMLVVDNSPSMHYPRPQRDKIKFSLLLAASLAHLLQKQRDAVGLTTFSEDLEIQTPVKSSGTHLHKLLLQIEQIMEEPSENKSTDVPHVLHQIATKLHKRSLVIIFSDMFDRRENQNQLFQALQHLKHQRHEVLLFHITDHKTEMDFEFEDRPYEFIDVESDQVIKAHPSQIREYYQKATKSYFEKLKMRCGLAKIDFVEVDINGDYEQVLLSYLLKRQKMV
ncbi:MULTISPECIES: DUF58 domain-containing protein [Persicobacter]|uniref:DUF58 domain-containing protein n=1 Tax=Persicobacter diffluens TaxID=981 RepID=A0AAN4VU73_9BACT|nr:DUF58 domain-containing protein [Persicobacter sp. CCB-QB2]GJM60179.1 hypothetical protein PEDI_07310 [Persicobacter diffluens]